MVNLQAFEPIPHLAPRTKLPKGRRVGATPSVASPRSHGGSKASRDPPPFIRSPPAEALRCQDGMPPRTMLSCSNATPLARMVMAAGTLPRIARLLSERRPL